MALLKKRKETPKTGIVRIEEIQDTTPLAAIVRSAVQTPRWDVHREPFQGFNSPPGRF